MIYFTELVQTYKEGIIARDKITCWTQPNEYLWWYLLLILVLLHKPESVNIIFDLFIVSEMVVFKMVLLMSSKY